MDLRSHHISRVAVLEYLSTVLTTVGLLHVLTDFLLAHFTSEIVVLVIWLNKGNKGSELVELVLALSVTELHLLLICLYPRCQFLYESVVV